MCAIKHFFKQNPITASLLTLTLAYFLAIGILYFGRASTAETIFQAGGLFGIYLRYYPAELWRLISPIFIHIGWEHLIMNAISLYFVGAMAEQWWGSWRFLALYLLSGLMGNVFVLFFTPDVVSAGASTAIFGLFSAIAIIGYFGSNPYLKQVGQSYQWLLVINLAFNLFTPSVSLAGHIGGAIGGALWALILTPRVEKGIFTKTQKFLALLTYTAITLGMLAISFIRPL